VIALSPRLEDYGSFLTVAEAAAVLRIGRATAYDYVRDGVLPSVRLGHRVIVSKSALVALTAEPVKP
jgi:excisionase family DNA binding protein